MPTITNETFPFTEEQLATFLSEIDAAGSFIELMRRKNAVIRKSDGHFIKVNNNIERYKEKFLINEYESLRPFYETEMPYLFWNALYEVLQKYEANRI